MSSQPEAIDALNTEHLLIDLKGRSVSGGLLSVVSQVSQVLLQSISTVVLARLLTPADFGLVAMVTAVTVIAAGFAEALEIRVAYKEETPIAAILTLQFKDVVYYKYGCSDARFNKFGATPWLFWKAIAAAKSNGASKFDMGRTKQDNAGLLAFKNQWVPNPKRLVYWQYPYASSLDGGWNHSTMTGLAGGFATLRSFSSARET